MQNEFFLIILSSWEILGLSFNGGLKLKYSVLKLSAVVLYTFCSIVKGVNVQFPVWRKM